jgi:hypothetical protein
MTHPTAWWGGAKNSFIDFAKTIGGETNAHNALLADVYSRPNFLNGEYHTSKILHRTEEQFPATLPARIPGLGRMFRASEYAFTGSALRMRTRLYDMLSENAKENGVKWDKTEIESLGKLVNSLTARGQWGKTGEPAVVRMVMWAPKMLKANIDVLSAHRLTGNLESKFARKQAALNLLKIVGETAVLMTIANAIEPGSAETDPRSSRFGTIKLGNTLFDITGGAASVITLAARIITRETKTTKTGDIVPYGIGYGARSPFDALVDFLVNKTTPPARVVIDWLKGKTYRGTKFTFPGAIYQATTPIVIQQAMELKDDASADKVAGIIADGLGINARNYEFNKEYKNPYDELFNSVFDSEEDTGRTRGLRRARQRMR